MKIRVWAMLLFCIVCFTGNAQTEVYELRTYELEFFRSPDILHGYFEQALIPALNRQGVGEVGVFEETDDRMPKKLYLLIPFENIQAFQASKDLLEQDQQYLKDASSYLNAKEESIAYNQITTDLIRSSKGFPKLVNPGNEASFYELRIYTSHNEDALRRKVKMFNDHEFVIFEEVGLPIVFFGDNIAGNHMPCLTYLLAFKDQKAHEEAWSKFGPHPEWQRIIKLEEYANSMNNIIRIFLKPLEYSQF